MKFWPHFVLSTPGGTTAKILGVISWNDLFVNPQIWQ